MNQFNEHLKFAVKHVKYAILYIANTKIDTKMNENIDPNLFYNSEQRAN